MPAPAVARVRAQFDFSIYGQPASTSIWCSATGAGLPTSADMIALADAIGGDWISVVAGDWAPLNDASTFFEQVTCFYYAASSMAASQSGQGSNLHRAGSGVRTSAASQSIVMSLYTALISKSGRGRMYFPATASVAGGIAGVGFPAAGTHSMVTDFATHLGNYPGFAATGGLVSLEPVVQSIRLGQVHPVTLVLGDTRQDRQEIREKHQVYQRYQATV